jgi:glucose/arabinose dehydrogenase
MGAVMKKAGPAVPSANRITLLRDADGDGRAELKTAFVEKLRSPYGMALVGSRLYVANADSIVRFPYTSGQTRITASAELVTHLPAGRNHHWTKNILPSRDGSRLYATVGANSNIAEHGMAEEEGRAAVWEVDVATGNKRPYTTGLRNPLGLAWGEGWPAPFAAGMFVGEHGSWNRKPMVGYKVVFVPFTDGQPKGHPIDVLSGFIDAEGRAQDRPVGVAMDARGGLLVADDVGNSVWRVRPR